MDELKNELSLLMHEIMKINKQIFENGDYYHLLHLCEQDITILLCLEEHWEMIARDASADGKTALSSHAESLQSKENNMTAKEISELLSVPKTTIVTAITRLVSRDYIVRHRNENDRREMLLSLTQKGRKAVQEHNSYEKLILNALVDRWDANDQIELAKILKRRK